MFFLVRSKPCRDNLWLMLAGWVLFLAQPGIAGPCPVYLAGQKTPYTIVFRAWHSGSIHTELRRSGPAVQLNAPASIDDERSALVRCIEEGFDDNVKKLCMPSSIDDCEGDQREYLEKSGGVFKYNENIKLLWDPQNFNFFRILSQRARKLCKTTDNMNSGTSRVFFYDNIIDAGNEGAEQYRQLVPSRFECNRDEAVLIFTAVQEREWANFPNGEQRNVKGTPEAVLYEWELKINNSGEVVAANLIYPGLSNQSLLTCTAKYDLYLRYGLFLTGLLCVGCSPLNSAMPEIFCLLGTGCTVTGLFAVMDDRRPDKAGRVVNSINLTSTLQGTPKPGSEQAAAITRQPFVGTGSDIRRRNSE